MQPKYQTGFWCGRRVAITGATGFVGHHLAMQLAGLGARVTAVVRASSRRFRLEAANICCMVSDLNDSAALAQACQGQEFIFHLAGAVDFGDDWERCRRVNVEGTRHVFEAARSAGVRRMIHTSSIVAVGAGQRPRVVDESARWNLARLKVPYVTTKRVAEDIALGASGKDLEVVVVNPGCVVGPDDFSGSEFGTLCRRFWRGRVPVYFGGGNNFVDVRDVAAGHLLAAERGMAGQRYILGGVNLPYHAFFAALARHAPRPIFRLRMPTALAGLVAALDARRQRRYDSPANLTAGQARMLPLFFYFDWAKARRELGYSPRPLAQSLADAYRFWIERRTG
jgi:dihydroflavonol-4-reductase